jgi:ribonuclease HII
VVAKVTRDRLMCELDTRFPAYGFAEHKGYSTAGHMKALSERGPCPEHRYSFVNVRSLGRRGTVEVTVPDTPGIGGADGVLRGTDEVLVDVAGPPGAPDGGCGTAGVPEQEN